jgi:hypothetical protein
MKRKLPLILILFCAPLLMFFNPQPKQITEKFFPEKNDLPEVTPGLKKKNKFTNYEELIGFLQQLKKEFPDRVQIEFIGKSKKGKSIPMIRIQTPGTQKKVRVWMQGGLHGNEPASTEAMLYLLYDLLHNKDQQILLQHIDLAVVPMANIDGYLKQKRNNAEGLDLNRDQTKLMAVESPLLKSAFTSFAPHVSLDFHEYLPYRRDFVKLGSFGVTSAFDVMLLYSGNLNVPQAQRTFTQDIFLNPTRAELDKAGLTHHDYVTPFDEKGHLHFNRGSDNARSSATNFALLRSISTLVEVRGVGLGRASFKRRTYTGYLIARKFLEIAVEQKEAIFKLLETDSDITDEVIIKTTKKVYKGSLEFIDIDKAERVQIPTHFKDAWFSEATLKRKRPLAYLIEKEQSSLINKLKAYHLKIDTLKSENNFDVEQYFVETYQQPSEKSEKMKLQLVTTRVEKTNKRFPVGSFYILTNQPYGNILPELLEPEAPNSFVHFGVLRVRAQEYLPIYRIPNP